MLILVKTFLNKIQICLHIRSHHNVNMDLNFDSEVHYFALFISTATLNDVEEKLLSSSS